MVLSYQQTGRIVCSLQQSLAKQNISYIMKKHMCETMHLRSEIHVFGFVALTASITSTRIGPYLAGIVLGYILLHKYKIRSVCKTVTSCFWVKRELC